MVDFKALIAERRERHNIENRPAKNLNISISVAGADYAVSFAYNKALLDKFKQAIPESERNWHQGRRVWLISPDELQTAISVLMEFTLPAPENAITLPTKFPQPPEVVEKTFLLEYLGATKDRGKKVSAYGFVNNQWSVEITEEVLRGFFEGGEVNSKPDGLQTLYQVLCVFESVTPEEIGKAYKRLARQWHPDVCKEPDAHERFIKINDAYKVLIDPEQRRRYDAGLYFERQGQDSDLQTILDRYNKYGYRSPLRCGQITAKGSVRLMRFTVSEILKWDDVIRDGRVMVTSWPKGGDHFVTEWLNQSPF